MTIATYRLKLTRTNTLKLKVSTRIPAQFVGGDGIDIAKTNGTYTVDLDYSELGVITTYQDALEATTYLASWESVSGTFSKQSITNIKADLTATFGGVYQPLDADLTALAGLTSAADTLPYFTGSGTAALATLTTFARTLIDDTTQGAMQTTLGLVPGTNVQAFDADLAALAANSTDGLWAHTAAGTGAARTLTAPAAGITITNPAGIAGNPTLVLANDLAAVEGLASTGIARRTGTDAWSVGTLVTNAEHATMAAYTLKGNATGSIASQADIDITALTSKASPVSGDIVLIQDSAASNAMKKTTVGALASAGSVASIGGNTGAFTLNATSGITNSTNDIILSQASSSQFGAVKVDNTSIKATAGVISQGFSTALLQASTAAPTGTTSATLVMMGCGVTNFRVTPTQSGRVVFSIQGSTSATSSSTGSIQLRYGTGAGPANGVAATGTVAANTFTATSAINNAAMPFRTQGIVTGLALGTAVWFDIALSNNAGATQTITGVDGNAIEF